MNIGTKKNQKTLLEINAQLGRNQIVQHLFKVLLTKVFKSKPSKSDFLEYVWQSGLELIPDLPDWIECEEQTKETVKPKTEKRTNQPRKKLF